MARIVVAGVDVGAERKGFHAVALKSSKFFDDLETTDPAEVTRWCKELGVKAVGIDAPCKWNTSAGLRPSELGLRDLGINCFATPTRAKALDHPKDNYGWMLNGERLYRSLRTHYRLIDWNHDDGEERGCFETFPHAVAHALSPDSPPKGNDFDSRNQLLLDCGIDLPPKSPPDIIDAALCAVVADQVARRQSVITFGESRTGFIVVPDWDSEHHT